MKTLLMSPDPATGKTLTDTLQALQIDLVICKEFGAASRELSRAKYHALFLDSEAANGRDLLRVLRNSPSNKTAVVLAISSAQKCQQASGDICREAQFVIQRPLARAQVEATLRAARGLLLRELRQYYRYPLDVPVTLIAAGRNLPSKATNISLGGIGIRMIDPISLSGTVHVRLKLPDGDPFEGFGEIIWSDEQGRAGIHFSEVAPLFQTRLETWLTSKLEEQAVDAEMP